MALFIFNVVALSYIEMNTLRINHTARRRAEALISNYARRLLQIDEKNLGLLEEHLSQTQEPELPDVIENRQNPCWVVPPDHGSNTPGRALPVTALKAEILDAIDKNQIIFISGGTGCGKSTQVPQYILERAFERKEPVNVVISMPRRLPTATLCKRITEEFGEAEGETIAHKIRHEDTANMPPPSPPFVYKVASKITAVLDEELFPKENILPGVNLNEYCCDILEGKIRDARSKSVRSASLWLECSDGIARLSLLLFNRLHGLFAGGRVSMGMLHNEEQFNKTMKYLVG